MLHFKYYIILLVGIFLALGLGIMIGVTLENNNVLENQQELIIHQIEREFEALRNETDMLKKALAEAEKQKAEADYNCEYLLSQLIENRLQGLRVSIVNLYEDSVSNDLGALLRLAGASVESKILINDDLFTRGDVCTALETFVPNIEHQLDKDFNHIVALELVSSIIQGTFTPLSAKLSEMRLIQVSSQLKQGSDVVILSGKYKDNAEQSSQDDGFNVVFIQTALDMGLPVVAVEPSWVEKSAVLEYQELGIPAVRDIDTVYGKLALISVLEASTSQ